LNNNQTSNYQNKEKENFNAFVDMMAQLIQKYGNRVLNNTNAETEKESEQRR